VNLRWVWEMLNNSGITRETLRPCSRVLQSLSGSRAGSRLTHGAWGEANGGLVYVVDVAGRRGNSFEP